MKPYIRITRIPYEEPDCLNLAIAVSNGSATGNLELYLNADELITWADAFETFPLHAKSVCLWEVGSERPEDRWAYYVRLRLFTTDSVGHCALHVRLNNNRDLPDREIVEMCIRAEPVQLNQFGKLCRNFAKLKHRVLYWSLSEAELFETTEQAEQFIPADA